MAARRVQGNVAEVYCSSIEGRGFRGYQCRITALTEAGHGPGPEFGRSVPISETVLVNRVMVSENVDVEPAAVGIYFKVRSEWPMECGIVGQRTLYCGVPGDRVFVSWIKRRVVR